MKIQRPKWMLFSITLLGIMLTAFRMDDVERATSCPASVAVEGIDDSKALSSRTAVQVEAALLEMKILAGLANLRGIMCGNIPYPPEFFGLNPYELSPEELEEYIREVGERNPRNSMTELPHLFNWDHLGDWAYSCWEDDRCKSLPTIPQDRFSEKPYRMILLSRKAGQNAPRFIIASAGPNGVWDIPTTASLTMSLELIMKRYAYNVETGEGDLIVVLGFAELKALDEIHEAKFGESEYTPGGLCEILYESVHSHRAHDGDAQDDDDVNQGMK